MKKNFIDWTDERLQMLCQYYPTESNERVALRLGISSRTIARKANELNLHKQIFSKSKLIEDSVKELYSTYSLKEIAKKTNVSWRTVHRVAKKMELCRTPEEESRMRSRIRRKIIKSERGRVAFGLDQRTHIKLVCNHERIRLRTKLKSVGYIVFKGNNTIYYPLELKRHPIREQNGRKVGLSFAPWCPPAIISNLSSLSA